MRAPLRLWQALERIPGLAAVVQEWRSLLGDEYELVEAFLRPNGKLATGYPCPESEGCGCVHAVVAHAPDDSVAVCRCTPRRCEAIPLRRQDIVVYELNRSALGASIASALQITQDEKASVDRLPMTFRIGTYFPYAGFRFPVFMTFQIEPEEYRRVVEALVARNDKPFVLLAPTRDLHGSDCEDFLRRRDAAFFPLSEFLVWDDKGALTTNRPVEEIWSEFRQTVLPSPKDSDSMAFFPTPPGSTWGDVSIRFKDGHTVSVKVKSAGGVYNYTQMGMANKKNGEPTVQWKLLYAFSEGRGVLDWTSPHAHRKNQTRREKLAENLRSFFRIEGDPFRVTDDGKGWQARFSILPDE
jgi:hypothetical protein